MWESQKSIHEANRTAFQRIQVVLGLKSYLLHTLSWAALIFPLLLSGILAQASS